MCKKKQFVFLDSNTFYYFCDYIGSKSNVINVKGNTAINYELLYKEFASIIHGKHTVLCLSPTVVLEVLIHFRNDQAKLDDIFETFRKYWNDNHFELGYQNYEPYLQANDAKGHSLFGNILQFGFKPSLYISDALSEKIRSEAELTTLLIYMIFITYVFMFYKLDEELLNPIMPIFGTSFVAQYDSILKPNLTQKIKNHLSLAYASGTEDKVIQKIFDDLLEDCSNHCLSIIGSCLTKNDSVDYLISMLDTNGKSVSKRIRRWYLDNARKKYFVDENGNKKETIDFVLDTIKPAIISKAQNEGQYYYLKSKVLDFYNSGRLIEKNDAEDYWMMFLASKGRILSFDEYIRKVIRLANSDNADYINGFSNTNI